ncbi:selenide, water dikinase (plasmid) [Fulvitalea axinellae]|uniref:Selenide, water dikinase n=1 Tax=Fulvitalea axinellae TaxID=1182444 RepID=A0AAU9D467_9BACT|nr:selenide, water dikinase [Fulvitalea axinellae]
MEKIDLLKTVEYGGCSAKLSPTQLAEILSKLPKSSDERLLVDIDTHDDAGVYKLNDDTALIYTTDFFPPVCSDPFEFGQIAAANALSDVYAMGGTPIMALNIMMFSADKLPVEAFAEILQGGHDKVSEAGALTVGGHTIDDHPPKFGLAVVGTVQPDKLITNAKAQVGDALILTKPLGIGALIAGHREELAKESDYKRALEQMKLLNKKGAEIMAKHGAKAATDVTGFGLLGHAREIAKASDVSLIILTEEISFLPGAYELYDDGCIPGAAFRNLDYVKSDTEFGPELDYNLKMLCCDPQTSGGLLISIPSEKAHDLLSDLHASGIHDEASIIGEVVAPGQSRITLI